MLPAGPLDPARCRDQGRGGDAPAATAPGTDASKPSRPCAVAPRRPIAGQLTSGRRSAGRRPPRLRPLPSRPRCESSSAQNIRPRSRRPRRPPSARSRGEPQEGLIPFLIASAIGGLFALVMPCVWPMVPITVNFFVKQGQAKQGARRPAWRSPIAWRSSASSRRSASSSRSSSRPSSLQNLANNPWLNFVVAGALPGVRPEPAGPLRDPPAQLPAQRLGAGRGPGRPGRRHVHGADADDHVVHLHLPGRRRPARDGGRRATSSTRSSAWRPSPRCWRCRSSCWPCRPGLLVEDAPERRLDERRQGRRRPGRDRRGVQVHQHGRDSASSPPENAWFDAQVVLTIWVVLSAVCGLYLLGPLPHRPRSRRGQGRARPDDLRARCSSAWPSSWPRPCSAGRRRAWSGTA